MICLDIPYIPENNRIDRDLASKELRILNISAQAKENVHAAIYNIVPRTVEFENRELAEVLVLEKVLRRLGVPYRQTESTE
jgi:hypothetical protein